MKYQNYELRTYKQFEQNLKKIQAWLALKRKTLTKTRISTFKKIHEFEFVDYYILIIKCEDKKTKTRKKKFSKMKTEINKKKIEDCSIKWFERNDRKNYLN